MILVAGIRRMQISLRMAQSLMKFQVILPEIFPAALTGFGLAFARGIGEYGSVEFISKGDRDTTVVSMLIMKELNAGSSDYAGATAIALVMLIFSFLLLFTINIVQGHFAKHTALC